MDAPKAIEKVKSTKSYSIISDKNNSFYLTIQNQYSIIYFLSYYQDDIIKHNYDKKLELEELKKNKYLSLCDNIDEIYYELINLLDKNQAKIFERNNEIDLNIPTEHLKIKEIKISMNKIIMNNNEKIEQIFSLISNLKEEINNLKGDNNNLQEKINNLQEDNNNLRGEINNLRGEINNLRGENNNLQEEINNLQEVNNNIREGVERINERITILDEVKLNKKIEIKL